MQSLWVECRSIFTTLSLLKHLIVAHLGHAACERLQNVDVLLVRCKRRWSYCTCAFRTHGTNVIVGSYTQRFLQSHGTVGLLGGAFLVPKEDLV